MGAPGPEYLAPIEPISGGLRSAGACSWNQSCGRDQQGRSCGTCDDEDPATLDRCVDDFTCIHASIHQPTACQPSCTEPGPRLVPVSRLHHASGGLQGLAGLQGVAVSNDDQDVYLAARESKALTHLTRVDGKLRFASSHPVGPAIAVAISGDGRSVYVAGREGLLRFTRDQRGAIAPTGEQLPAAWGLATWGPWLAAMDTKTITLYRDDAGADGRLRLVQVLEDPDLAGVRSAVFSPEGKHLYVAGFDRSTLSAWKLTPVGAEKIASINSGKGLLNVDALAITPQGDQLYAAGFCDHSLAIFTRNPASGALSWQGTAAPQAEVQGCVPGMYAQFGDDEMGGGPFATPTSLAVSRDGSRVAISSLSTWFNLRLYQRNGSELTLLRHVDASPQWLDYSRFPWANEEIDGEGPPMPTRPWLYRPFSQVVAGAERFYITNGIVDALAEMDHKGSTAFTQKGQGGVGNLAGAYNMEISPDSRHVYIAPRGSSGVAVGSFASDRNGKLEALPFPVRQLEASGEGAVLNVAVTRPDGAFAAVVEADYPTLYLYRRDPTTGILSEAGQLPIPGCGGQRSFPVDVVSHPGGHLYVADFQWQGKGCIHHFQVDPSGTLSAAGSYPADFLRGVEAIAISSDGRHLYAACHEASTVAHFDRNPDNGSLAARDPIERADLHGAEFIVISPDDRHLYVTSPVEDNIVVLARNPIDGRMSHLQTVKKSSSAPLKGAAGITISPDGQLVFVASRTDDSITVLKRDKQGRLEPVSARVDPKGLDWVNGVAVSNDGRLLYSAAVQSNAISSFRVVPRGEDGCGLPCP